jgi:hypothetical protein
VRSNNAGSHNLTGTLNNTTGNGDDTLTLDASTGALQLVGGTIRSGRNTSSWVSSVPSTCTISEHAHHRVALAGHAGRDDGGRTSGA